MQELQAVFLEFVIDPSPWIRYKASSVYNPVGLVRLNLQLKAAIKKSGYQPAISADFVEVLS